MQLIYVLITLNEVFNIEAYTNNLFNLIRNQGNATGIEGGCKSIIDVGQLIKKKMSLVRQNTTSKYATYLPRTTVVTATTASKPSEDPDFDEDPMVGFQEALNKVLFGDGGLDNTEQKVPPENSHEEGTIDHLAMFPSGKVLRSEIFQNKTGVHLPRREFLHRGHLYLDTTNKDYMQTAVNAFSILLEGSLEDVQRLPAKYVLRSSRTIAMLMIAREKLVATWKVVKGNQRTEEVGYLTLEYYRPLFKYVNGREMARLNLSDERILSFLGTHAELNRHQVGVIASEYLKRNPDWSNPKYLNLMNNLLCGVPMKFMRRIPENVYLQLSHQLFYHIRACDPLQRRFYLAMMTRTQVLGKSNSWGARDVARLGLLLSEVEGSELSAINPEAMAGITPQVMMEMSPRNLMYLTETQTRYLAQKPRNILTKKMDNFEDEFHILNSGNRTRISDIIFCVVLAIKVIIFK